ncbi:MAG: Hint domain-containing protein [Acetobacter persici]|uniref:Hint domain-containing protein n=1 Tax=Acetobacter persici TaxID=1076596 RepID=UPI0039E97831
MSNTYLWTGAQNTEWNNPNNWNVVNGTNVTTQTGVPGATDSILIMSGNTLNQAGYTYNGDANAMNNAVKNMTPTLSGSTPVTVANVTLGGNGGPATLITGSTPFTVTGTLEDPQSAGFRNAQGGTYSLQGTDIHIVHLNWGTGGNVSYGTSSTPANITVDWMSGAGQNDNGNNSVITVTKGYDVDNSGTPAFRDGNNGNNNWNIKYASGAEKRNPNACFLSGSAIRTPEGDVAVENIKIGDEVVTFDWKNNRYAAKPVVWVGKARATVRPGLHDDEAGYPVRVLKDAVSDGVPYKDMLITAEHCLFFKGKFVPVRMLVNGASIFYDKSITSYDYYHVETEQHSVITADGMLTESYLDTGNRSSFRQEGRVVALHGTARTWEKDAGAPLCVDRAFVEPLFRMLEWREDSVAGSQTSANAPALTQDPDLHLVTETDAVIRPMRKAAHHYSFMLPPGTQSVRIVSRTSRPADVTGPFVDDRRSMGVAVADIHLFCAKSQHDISAHRQAVKPAGWYPSEGAQCVWTNGDAELPLGDYLKEGKMGILSLQILAAGPYIIRAEETAETQVKTA